MLGQPASWQTVCRPAPFTRLCICVYSGPIVALVRIHSGLRSIGVCALRASMCSARRPSIVVTGPLASATGPPYAAGGREPASTAAASASRALSAIVAGLSVGGGCGARFARAAAACPRPRRHRVGQDDARPPDRRRHRAALAQRRRRDRLAPWLGVAPGGGAAGDRRADRRG